MSGFEPPASTLRTWPGVVVACRGVVSVAVSCPLCLRWQGAQAVKVLSTDRVTVADRLLPWAIAIRDDGAMSESFPVGRARVEPLPERTMEQVRQALGEFMCPWCGAGPFQVVANHTNQMHGVDRRSLRDAAGMTYGESLTPPELHERNVGHGRRQASANPAWRRSDLPKSLSLEGRSRLRASADRARLLRGPQAFPAGAAAKGRQAFVDAAARRRAECPLLCVMCGGEFDAARKGRSTRKTCSPQCFGALVARNNRAKSAAA